ncbi:hypothetical protein [Saccharopolyspora phatthalungensis]|uniref:PE-PGRS family protein n=1 Tax=Saccharopolyspora phatthalungensis TaxID=664693 RepID=A0A840PRK3_9PSEU|nr:hypothetical protein [Saccharopolyspora phatthalungensis]MBB5152932.1 hypothetical protein [Saccharopolyspora phatthalungensis]
MRRWDPLNENQLDLLKRVDASEDLSGPEHARLRHSANAVRDRGLITISKRGGVWRAEMTKAGRFYLDQGHHPDDPRYRNERAQPTTRKAARSKRQSSKPAPPNQQDDEATGTSTGKATPSAPHATVIAAQRRRAEALELVERLVADNLVVIKAPSEDKVAQMRKIVDFAKRHNLVPDGHHIEKTRQWNRDRDLHIRLHKGSHANTKSDTGNLPPVPVPESLRAPHPVVVALRDDQGRLVMQKELRRRCLLLLQGLAAEAAKRGHKITEQPVSERHHHYGYGTRSGGPRYSRRDGHINLVVSDFSYTVTIRQLSPQSEDPDKARRLVIELPAYHSEGRQYRWTDAKLRTVEDGLAALLREAETRAIEDRQRQIDEERAKAERKVRWEQAMKLAQQKAIEAHYAKVLDEQVERWQRAKELRAYYEELEHRLANPRPTDGDLMPAHQWLSWINDHITREDPIEHPPAMPEPPRLRHDDLTPYLNGWSPHGPEGHLHSWQCRR